MGKGFIWLFQSFKYGEVGSSEAKDKLLSYLEPDNLGFQLFVGKQDVAEKLIVSMKEVQWS